MGVTPQELLSYLSQKARNEYRKMELELERAKRYARLRKVEAAVYRSENERLKGLMEEFREIPDYRVGLILHKMKGEELI